MSSVIARSSSGEAIQAVSADVFLGCFAALPMTADAEKLRLSLPGTEML